MESTGWPDSPLTDAEVEFVHQFVFEQLQLTPGPAHRWFAKQGLNTLDIGWFGIAMSKARIETPVELMWGDSPTWTPAIPFQVPWSDRDCFLNRLHAIRQWLNAAR